MGPDGIWPGRITQPRSSIVPPPCTHSHWTWVLLWEAHHINRISPWLLVLSHPIKTGDLSVGWHCDGVTTWTDVSTPVLLLVKPPGKATTFSFLILCLPSNIVFCCLHQIVWPRRMGPVEVAEAKPIANWKGICQWAIRSVPEELGKLEPRPWSMLEEMDKPVLLVHSWDVMT